MLETNIEHQTTIANATISCWIQRLKKAITTPIASDFSFSWQFAFPVSFDGMNPDELGLSTPIDRDFQHDGQEQTKRFASRNSSGEA
ncbi:MAG: hypothetical protein WBF93_02190 [Pirellulales bacterium]